MDHLVHRLRRKKTGHWDRQRQAKTSEEQDVKGDREREESERGRVGGREVIQASVNTVLRAWL